MDNNFNQQQPQQGQPVYQQGQPVYQQPQQGQPVYQQPQVQPMYQQPPKKPTNINVMELVALICSAVGMVMAIVGATLTCSCSASKTYESSVAVYSLSAVFIVTIFGVIIAAAGIVLAIVALKQNGTVKAGKLSYVAIAVGVFAVIYGILPTLTICGYNCSLESAKESVAKTNPWNNFNY